MQQKEQSSPSNFQHGCGLRCHPLQDLSNPCLSSSQFAKFLLHNCSEMINGPPSMRTSSSKSIICLDSGHCTSRFWYYFSVELGNLSIHRKIYPNPYDQTLIISTINVSIYIGPSLANIHINLALSRQKVIYCCLLWTGKQTLWHRGGSKVISGNLQT